MKDFVAIGIFQPKHTCNVGTLFRSALIFNVDMIFTIGPHRYSRQGSDTVDATQHIKYVHYNDVKDFLNRKPLEAKVISVELDERSKSSMDFEHPRQGIYILGNEANGICKKLLDESDSIVQIPGKQCLNVAVAGSILLYDRILKCQKRQYIT